MSTGFLKQEFQAVILAGGQGHGLSPITDQVAKCRIPIANRPLLSFQYEMLEKAGFTDVILVMQEKTKKDSVDINLLFGKTHMTTSIETVPENLGTADVLRRLRHKLHSDFFVLSSDVVSDVPLHHLADLHRIRNGAATVLLYDSSSAAAVNSLNSTAGNTTNTTTTTTTSSSSSSSSSASSSNADKNKKNDDSNNKKGSAASAGQSGKSNNKGNTANNTTAKGNANNSNNKSGKVGNIVDVNHDAPAIGVNNANDKITASQSMLLLQQQKEYIGLNHNNQLLYLHSVDNEGNIRLSTNGIQFDHQSQSSKLSFKKPILEQFPSIAIHKNLSDMHIYLFSHWVLDVLEAKPKFSSIQTDLIPYLVNCQVSNPNPESNKAKLIKKFMDQSVQIAYKLSSAPVEETRGFPRCFAHVAGRPNFCMRANTMEAYIELNRILSLHNQTITSLRPWEPLNVVENNFIDQQQGEKGEGSIVGANCIIGASVQLGGQTKIERSVIGKHVTIGKDCSIINSIVMDHVRILDGCRIENSIVSSNSYISKKATLLNCRLGSRFEVSEGLEMINESLSNESINY